MASPCSGRFTRQSKPMHDATCSANVSTPALTPFQVSASAWLLANGAAVCHEGFLPVMLLVGDRYDERDAATCWNPVLLLTLCLLTSVQRYLDWVRSSRFTSTDNYTLLRRRANYSGCLSFECQVSVVFGTCAQALGWWSISPGTVRKKYNLDKPSCEEDCANLLIFCVTAIFC